MRPILIAFGKAVLSQLHFRMLMLTVMPFLLSVAIWGIILWLCLQPMIDWLQSYFLAHGIFKMAGGVLDWLGMGAITTVLVPLIAMWVLLPLMVLTALVFVGTLAVPTIAKHVSSRDYPELEARKGGSLWGSLWISTFSFIIFIVLWIVSLPLTAIPPLAFIIHPILWGWLTYRVMAYDVLAEHATDQERTELMRLHRWQLLVIGAIAGTMGAAPTLLWLGGALSVIFFPLLAAVSIWLYVLVFVFTGLWFEHYCLEALAKYRMAETAIIVPTSQALKDIN